MYIRDNAGLFGALEKVLRASTEPLDCAVLYDMPEIRKHATSVNRVSDYLGHMWRKDQLLRLPAAKESNNRSRWAYVWKRKQKERAPTAPDLSQAMEYNPRVEELLKRQTIEITAEGDDVVLTFPQFTFIIKMHPGK